ncbi:hypothetical protein [Streptomyces sp. NPDC060322]
MGRMTSAIKQLRGRIMEADGKALQDPRRRDEGRRLQEKGRGGR